jgi:hypothetical protein
MTTNIPYTYRISWTKLNKHYYGVRYSKNCHPSDLWKSYFTSSKHVEKFRKEYGEPDIVEIRKIFDDANKAKIWENRVLIKLKVIENDCWLNKSFGGDQHILRQHSSETKKKMSENNVSKREYMKKIISNRQSGKNNSFYGRKHSEESKKIKSEKNKGYFWWTDGHTNIKSKTCPSGYRRGRTTPWNLRSNLRNNEIVKV